MRFLQLNEETSPEIIAWLLREKQRVLRWTHPKDTSVFDHSPLFFDMFLMKKKSLIVIPFYGFWMPEDGNIVDVLKTRGCQKVYATGFGPNDNFFLSSPTESENLNDMQVKLFRHCLNVSIDESFFILNTYWDYWIIAAPAAQIREMFSESLEVLVSNFLYFSKENKMFEAGHNFADFLASLCRRHNQEMQEKEAK